MLLVEQGTTVATCHASRCVTVSGGLLFYEHILEQVFSQGAQTLGEAVLAAKQAIIGQNPGDDWLYGPAVLQTVLGDPALRISVLGLPTPSLAVELTGTNSARLTWTEVLDAQQYEIFRSDLPYWSRLGVLPWHSVPAPSLEFMVVEGIGDLECNYSYVARARSGSAVSAISNTVGEYDFLVEH
jgi:hypothetical protein